MAKKKEDYSWVGWLLGIGAGLFALSRLNATDTTSAAGIQSDAAARAMGRPTIDGGPTYEGEPADGVLAADRTIFRQPPIWVDPWNPPPRLTPCKGEITLRYGETPPTPRKGCQWWTPPTGTQPEYVTWYLEPEGTYHDPIDPTEVLGAAGGGFMEDTEPQPLFPPINYTFEPFKGEAETK